MIKDQLIPGTIMALVAAFTGWTGWRLTKRGQQDTREQQQAANVLQTRVNAVDELEHLIDVYKAEITRLEDVLTRVKAEHTEEADRQARRCQEQLDAMIDTLATLQTVVNDEIARSAALGGIRDAQAHEASDHDRDWPEPGPPRY